LARKVFEDAFDVNEKAPALAKLSPFLRAHKTPSRKAGSARSMPDQTRAGERARCAAHPLGA
jgi:hypothetical protein